VNFSIKVKFSGWLTLGWRVGGLCIFLLLLAVIDASAQVEKPVRLPKGDLPSQTKGVAPDTVGVKADSLGTSRIDSLSQKNQSDIETTITYSARDSINSSMQSKIVHLYGDAKIKYGMIELMAENITIDYTKSTISAEGTLDSLGRRVGYPVFINGAEKYETKSIVYNFKNKKALISEIVTTQGDGFIHGQAVFKNPKNELLSLRNAYTTCNLVHPHYEIMATRAKAIPGDKIVVGPFYMKVNSVPLPLGFAFGMFPSPRKSASGIIVPAYGEERNRGFFLRNGGYFFDVNEYFKLQLTGDIYSKGSSAVYVNSTYSKRYRYGGNFNFSFTNNKTSPNIEDPTSVKDFRITWSHSPQTRGSGRFSASVNAATATYNNSNFLPLNTNPTAPRLDNTSRKLSSNVSYSKTFGALFSTAINFRINQDLTTKQVDIPLPDLSFNVNNIYPFKRASQSMFFQNFSTRFTMTATNQVTNNLGKADRYGVAWKDIHGNPITHDSIAPFNFQNLPALIQNAKKGIRTNIPFATSFKVLKFFTMSPSINIDELIYFDKLDWRVDSTDSTKAVSKIHSELNTVTNYSLNMGMTTRIYGTYFLKGGGNVKAIRHIINPSIGYSYSPDFGDPSYGYYQEVKGIKGSKYPVYKSVHDGFVYGSSRFGKSSAISFGINNNIEMKVKSKKDTVVKKVALFNTLSIGSNYNFAVDSMNLAPFAMSANTNVLNDKLNINLTGTLDPYEYAIIQKNEDPTQRKEVRSREYAWGKKFDPAINTPNWSVVSSDPSSLGRITNANLALSTNFNPKGQKKDTDTRDKISKSNASDSDKKYLLANPDSYIDFNIPWNLRISYNVDYSHQAAGTLSKNLTNTAADDKALSPLITQAVRFNGDFSLTDKWKIVYNSGYDFQLKELTTTQLIISRDLHCWVINLSWVPFGKFQSYSFYIGVKSSLLKDLKLNRTRSFFDN
jgi:hypothetical protein